MFCYFLLLYLLVSIVPADFISLIPLGSPTCYNTTDPIECSRYAFDFSCLANDFVLGTPWRDVINCSYCCLLFWIKRLHPHRFSSYASSSEKLLVHDIQRWKDLFGFSDQFLSPTAIQIKYQHIPEPTIRFVESVDQIVAALAATPRSITFITTNFSNLLQSAKSESNVFDVIASPNLNHLYSYETCVDLRDDLDAISSEDKGNNDGDDSSSAENSNNEKTGNDNNSSNNENGHRNSGTGDDNIDYNNSGNSDNNGHGNDSSNSNTNDRNSNNSTSGNNNNAKDIGNSNSSSNNGNNKSSNNGDNGDSNSSSNTNNGNIDNGSSTNSGNGNTNNGNGNSNNGNGNTNNGNGNTNNGNGNGNNNNNGNDGNYNKSSNNGDNGDSNSSSNTNNGNIDNGSSTNNGNGNTNNGNGNTNNGNGNTNNGNGNTNNRNGNTNNRNGNSNHNGKGKRAVEGSKYSFRKITFLPSPSTVNLSDMLSAKSDEKPILLICLTSLTMSSSKQEIDHLRSSCNDTGFPSYLCELCSWTKIGDGKGINSISNVFTRIRSAKFILSFEKTVSQLEFVQSTILISQSIPITSQAMIKAECTMRKYPVDCIEWTVNSFSGKRLPIVYRENLIAEMKKSSKQLRKNVNEEGKIDVKDWLLTKHKEMTTVGSKYSITSLLFSYYFARIMPQKLLLEHIGRQSSRYKEFLSDVVPVIKFAINQSPAAVTSYFYRYPYKLKAICMIDHIPFIAMNDRQIITSESLDRAVLLSSRAQIDDRLRNSVVRPVLDIVIPRCCETLSGELSWLKLLLQDYKNIDGFLRISVYYKCPWCIPLSKTVKWISEYENYHHYLSSNLSIKNHSSPKNVSASPSSAYDVLLSKGGIMVIDEVKAGKGIVSEYPAFDWFVNGKEITAYLKHILNHYDQHALGNFTLFLHTKPSDHLEFRRFSELVKYLKICYHAIQAMVDYQHQVPFDSKIEYLHVNYRWMDGTWAHQPERCMIDVLDHIFKNSSFLGDERRLPSNSRSLTDFLRMPMASGVAAQFLVSDFSIYRRPRSFWDRLYAMNNGTTSFRTCNNRSYKEGTEVASAMERIWHNFFRDMTMRVIRKPRKCQDIAKETNRTAFPLYMEDYPSCCLHQLSSYMANISPIPPKEIAANIKMSCSSGSSMSRKESAKHRGGSDPNVHLSRYSSAKRPIS